MREITKLMVRDFNIEKLGYDFMGYRVDRMRDLSFHHTIVPRRNCGKMGLGDGYFYENGSILVQNTSHNYLHTIEKVDYDKFLWITSELIDENIKGEISKSNLLNIRDILREFESEHGFGRTKKGKILVKREYVDSRIDIGKI